ncbi:MAG: MBL fold metallo-hydrolase [Clostridia bacterium]|nr:MBL fold metallo-hydrolase [Clostridia bacterium]
MALSIERIVLGPIEANCYIVRNEGSKGALLIDPGDDYPYLSSEIQKRNITVDAIVVTHGHFDHLLSAAYLEKDAGAKIYASKEDAPALTIKSASLCPPGSTTPYMPAENIVILEEGGIELAGIPFTVIKTPGHTKGGICLYNQEERVIFTGDTLFDDGFGRTDLPGGDWSELTASLRRLLMLPPETTVYSGHGDKEVIHNIRKVLCP